MKYKNDRIAFDFGTPSAEVKEAVETCRRLTPARRLAFDTRKPIPPDDKFVEAQKDYGITVTRPGLRDYGDKPVFLALFPSCSARLVTRIVRIVVPGAAHHVTQRGNRRERVFFEDAARSRFETGQDGRVTVIHVKLIQISDSKKL